MKHAILKNGQVEIVDLMTWARWLEQPDTERAVAYKLVGETQISTDFIGLDTVYRGGEPLWFETLVSGGASNGMTKHYSTLEEAKAGHERIVERIQHEDDAS